MTDTYTITYTARSTTYTLSGLDATTGLTIQYLGDQGFGLAPMHRITTRGPLQDGDSDIYFRLDPRVLQLPLMVVNASSASPRYQHYEIREKLLQIFRPGDDAYITVTRTDGTTTKTRRINVKVLGGLAFDVDPNTFHVRTVVQLRASDPTWYDPTTATLTINQANIGVNQTITNNGTWNEYPIITITGPITNPVVKHNLTIEELRFTGLTIAAGTTYYIDLRYAYKTVYDGPNQTGNNQISKLDAASNLTTWTLLPGSNSIVVQGSGTTAATSATFTYSSRFTGI
jgi:phage-related protein